MRIDPRAPAPQPDTWLEARLRLLEHAGKELALAVGEANVRADDAASGALGRRRVVTETALRRAEAAYRVFHDVQVEIQNAVFDCEHELRELRERDVSPAELLVDGERLIRQYRFLRRRARVLDGLLAYLPSVTSHASICLECLTRLRAGEELNGTILVPDCGFALVALEQLSEDDSLPRRSVAARPGE
jgi:hypothetical protein